MSYFDYNGYKIFYEEYGIGTPLVLLHGNTVSGKMFAPIIPILSEKYHVIVMDFLGCGQSERISEWPDDLWFEWSKQVSALCGHKGLKHINLIGSSGGALAAINVALENPELVSAVIADSFEGMKAKPDLTEQICIGRNYAKQNEGFCSMLKSMHGEDWENVLDADTDAVVRHAKNIGDFFHKSLSELQTKMLLTGSARDEMFQEGHYQELFDVICQETNMVQTHIFEQGGHPAIISNMKEFGNLCEQFFV